MDPLQLSGSRATHLKALSDKLNSVKSMLDNTKAGLPDGSPVVPELVTALTNEYQSLEAQFHREIMATAGGESGAVLAKGQSMRDVADAPSDVTLGGIVRGLGLGAWDGFPQEAKAMVLSGGAAAAVPGATTAGIVDLARQQSIVFQGGAQLLPIASPSAKVARMVSEPAIQWEPESAERDLSDGAWTFDVAELTASSAWLYTTLSIEAAEDAVGLEETLINAFSAQLGLAFDQAGFVGDGADQPVGLANMGAVQDRIIEMNDVGDLTMETAYRPFVQAVGAIKAAHHEPSSVVLTPDIWTEMNCLQDADYNPLGVPRAYSKLDEYSCSFLPSNGGVGTDEHTAIVGDLSAMCFGVRTGMTIEVSRTGSGFKKGGLEIRGYLRMGMYLTRPNAIAVMRGITIPAAI